MKGDRWVFWLYMACAAAMVSFQAQSCSRFKRLERMEVDELERSEARSWHRERAQLESIARGESGSYTSIPDTECIVWDHGRVRFARWDSMATAWDSITTNQPSPPHPGTIDTLTVISRP